MNHILSSIAIALVVATFAADTSAQQSPPKGIYSFGQDQTIADISKLEWGPLKLDGLPPGIEIAVLRGDLTKAEAKYCFGHLPSTSSPITATLAMKCTSG